MNAIRKLAVAAGLLALSALPAMAQNVERVTIQIDGAAVPYYVPLYLAAENGYFADAGLEVDFIYANAADIINNVAVGNVEFGFPNGDAVIAARANGLPVKVIHTTYQQGIGAVLFKKSSGIETIADLAGKRVAITSYGSPNYIQLQVMLREAGLSEDDVRIEVIGTGAIVDALKADQVDAIVFSMLRYYNLEADGIDTGMIRSDEYLPSHGNVLVTSERLLAQRPELARGFVEALDRALTDLTEGDVRPAVEMAIAEYAPSFAGQEELISRIISEVFVETLWQSPDTEAHGFGYGDLASWQTTIDTAAEYGAIPEAFDAADLVVQPGDL